MMQAILIYNPVAGSINQATADELTEALHQAGYEPVYKATNSVEDLDIVLAGVEGLVVAAGGDGTARVVATRLIGRNVPMSIVPMGTANNISASLGITGTPLEIVAGLQNPLKRRFDVGLARFPWGNDYFLESLGLGLFAEALATYQPEEGKSVIRALKTLVQVLTNLPSRTCQISLDGEDMSGNYLLFEILNTTAIGPRLKLAPDADPSDGCFKILGIHEDAHESFLRYVASLLTETLEELPSVTVAEGRRLEIRWSGFPIHVDENVWEVKQAEDGEVEQAADAPAAEEVGVVTVEVLPGALEFWCPGAERTVNS